ncbi:hypothetical protein CONLIGDRAFT_643310 [Coniochaeta ligniaria NRRL 30616]|uniref:Uncharacterized protein n=1 Tax=Coniochaeta ligniaria NRRL 30616 TaxID=1408157 RepID=A0A1J7JDA3_9PEZI|nr:hypothetical protein CONLIGDRAFT_643310 [Coniochaeta ligniaria NRRL 30616]
MAAVLFGFSAGDFIATITLIKDVVKALNDVSGARPAYQRLRTELATLDDALERIQSLETDSAQLSQKAALRAIATQCHDSITRFLDKNAKFQNTLGQPAGTNSVQPRWATSLHKVQWALLKDDSINALRAEIAGQTTTMNLMMNLIQAETLKNNLDTVENHDLLMTQGDMMARLLHTVEYLASQLQDSSIKADAQRMLRYHEKAYSTLLDVQDRLSNITSAEAHIEEPVHFEDAHGRIWQFHVNCVSCFTAFQSALETRFRDVPGLAKVKRREYVLKETITGKNVDPENMPWSSVCLPGRKLTMAMVFQRALTADLQTCPACHAWNGVSDNNNDTDTCCLNCGLRYERSYQGLPLGIRLARALDAWWTQGRPTRRTCSNTLENSSMTAPLTSSANSKLDDDDEIRQYRRVHIMYSNSITTGHKISWRVSVTTSIPLGDSVVVMCATFSLLCPAMLLYADNLMITAEIALLFVFEDRLEDRPLFILASLGYGHNLLFCFLFCVSLLPYSL